MKTKNLFLGVILLLMAIGCNRNTVETTAASISAEDASVSAKMDAASDDISNSVEDQFDATTANPTNSRMAASAFLPACATIIRTPALGTVITSGTVVTKTIDFQSSGCSVLSNGNVLKGKIIMSFTYNPTALSNEITIRFDNFYDNDFKIEGTKTLTRTMTVAGPSNPTHPKVTVNINLTITNIINGNVYTRTGTRVREFYGGFYTPLDWTDNLFIITGNWTTTYPYGNIQTATITTPVIVEYRCANTSVLPRPSVFTTGTILYTRNLNTATLDFGTGTCDNIAVFTLNGIAYTITIR